MSKDQSFEFLETTVLQSTKIFSGGVHVYQIAANKYYHHKN